MSFCYCFSGCEGDHSWRAPWSKCVQALSCVTALLMHGLSARTCSRSPAQLRALCVIALFHLVSAVYLRCYLHCSCSVAESSASTSSYCWGDEDLHVQESAVFCCIFLSTAGLQLFGGGVKIGWFEGILWLVCYLSLDVLFYFCTYFCLASSQLFLVDDFLPVIGPAVD